LPSTAGIADDLCFVKSLHTEAINHDPAITFIQTGSQQPGQGNNRSVGIERAWSLATRHQAVNAGAALHQRQQRFGAFHHHGRSPLLQLRRIADKLDEVA
jgi:hypothetical protein